jgi:hypothetical protein
MRFLFLFVALALGACSFFGPKPVRAPKPPPLPPRDVVKEIRLAAEKAGDVLLIQPVQNPRITVILGDVVAAEAVGNFKKSQRLLAEAQSIEGNNPLVVQFQAEIWLREKDYLKAETTAQKSFDSSAQTGPLCVRNWLTIAESRLGRKDLAGEANARTRAADCPHRAIERL